MSFCILAMLKISFLISYNEIRITDELGSLDYFSCLSLLPKHNFLRYRAADLLYFILQGLTGTSIPKHLYDTQYCHFLAVLFIWCE